MCQSPSTSLFRALFATVLLAAISSDAAQLGDPGEPLQVSEWIRGEPIKIEGSNTYIRVLVFWETGCAACTNSIHLLADLQKKFNDRIRIAAISYEAPETIKKFVSAHTDEINFTIASDDQLKSYNAYMPAFRQSIVPHAFIIGASGAVIWHRHTMAGLDQAIEQITSGRYDFEAEKRAEWSAALQKQYFSLIRTNPADRAARALGDQIITNGAANPWLLNNFAWLVLTQPATNAPPDVDLALRAAETAYRKAGETNASFADTYARALFDAGQKARAIEIEKRAIQLATDPNERKELEEALKRYESKP